MNISFEIIEKHIVPASAASDRLSEYARGVFESLPSRKSVVKAIKRGQLLVNGDVSSTGYWVQSGDEIAVVANPSEEAVYEKDLKVIFEDDHMAAIHKPGDLPVSGNMLRTVANALAKNLKVSSQKDRYSRPRPVHRLDRQTSGILLVAKTASAAANLGAQFENRTVKKRYRAIVQGKTEPEFKTDSEVDGRAAETFFKLISQTLHNRFGVLSELECKPVTGRKNQIRVHLSESGFPILGDQKFGGARSGRGLLLFAESVRFIHPFTEKVIDLKIELPKKFDRFMKAQKKRSSF